MEIKFMMIYDDNILQELTHRITLRSSVARNSETHTEAAVRYPECSETRTRCRSGWRDTDIHRSTAKTARKVDHWSAYLCRLHWPRWPLVREEDSRKERGGSRRQTEGSYHWHQPGEQLTYLSLFATAHLYNSKRASLGLIKYYFLVNLLYLTAVELGFKEPKVFVFLKT